MASIFDTLRNVFGQATSRALESPYLNPTVIPGSAIQRLTGRNPFEFGLSERLAPPAYAAGPAAGTQTQGGPNTGGAGGFGNILNRIRPTQPGPAPTTGQQPVQGPFQQQVPSGPNQDALQAIEQAYNATLGQISAQEQALSGQQASQIQQLQQGQQRSQAQIGQAQQAQQTAIGGRETEQQQAQTSALDQLRQLFQDVQSRQQAQLSAQGISSSSAAEALAAYLGRDMAQRVAGVNATTQDVLSNLADERKQVDEFAANSLTQLQQDTQNKVDDVNRQFSQALAQLGAIRGQAAATKNQQRAELFNQYQQQVAQIQQDNYNAQLAFQTWQQNISSRMTAAAQSITNIPLRNVENIQALGGTVTGAPTFGPQGDITGLNVGPQGVRLGPPRNTIKRDPITGIVTTYDEYGNIINQQQG